MGTRIGDLAKIAVDGSLRGALDRRAFDERWAELGSPSEPEGDPVALGPDGTVMRYAGGHALYADRRMRGAKPCFVYGAIGAKYDEMGGPASWLGWPRSDEVPFGPADGPDGGGRVNLFEHGAIHWWPDTGALPMRPAVAVRFKGFHAFGESDTDQVTGTDDQIYVIFGILAAEGASTRTTEIFSGVDGGENWPNLLELYTGAPNGVQISLSMFENDQGDPADYEPTIRQGITDAYGRLAAMRDSIPIVGPIVLGGKVGEVLRDNLPDLAHAITGLLGFEDDHLGDDALVLTSKRLITLANSPTQRFQNIDWQFESRLISADGGSWKCYFDVVQV